MGRRLEGKLDDKYLVEANVYAGKDLVWGYFRCRNFYVEED